MPQQEFSNPGRIENKVYREAAKEILADKKNVFKKTDWVAADTDLLSFVLKQNWRLLNFD